MIDILKLKIAFVTAKRAWAYCPVHNDVHHPNLSITLTDDYYGVYKCWACNAIGYFTGEQMETLKLNKKKRNKPAPIDWSSVTNEYCTNLLYKYPLFLESLATVWNVDKSILMAYSVGYDGEAYTFPMFNSDLRVIGIQRRWPHIVKGNKCCVEGSQLGMFLSRFSTDLWDREDRIVFICEGVSDAVAMYDLDFDTIGRPSCNFGSFLIKKLLNIIVSYKHKICIIPDMDKVGLKGAEEMQKVIRNPCNIFKFEGAKDIRDYIKLKGKEIVKQEILQWCESETTKI